MFSCFLLSLFTDISTHAAKHSLYNLKQFHPFTENEGVDGCELAFIATKCVYEADKEVRKITQAYK
jgi:hypothetical protein